MGELRSADGRYLAVEQGDGNLVLYLTATMQPLWDRWSYEAMSNGPAPSAPIEEPTPPAPSVPSQPAPSGGGALVRLTDDSDQAVRPIGMSYWPNINNHAGRAELFVLVSLNDVLTVFVVDKARGTVTDRIRLPFVSTGEGCYFSFTDPDLLYVPQRQGLMRYRISQQSTEVAADTSDLPDSRQFHSSADGRVHSFSFGNLAAVFVDGRLRTFPVAGDLDECQIDKSGRWLLIKFTVKRDGKDHLDNTIIDLNTGRDWTILDEDGACGHSDIGYGYMLGEDDYAEVGGAFRLWTFTDDGPVKGPIVYAWGGWDPMTRYVSHCNAKPGSSDGQRVLFSSSELGLVSVGIGANDPIQICASMTDVNASGGGSDVYWRKTRANLDPLGESACFSGNHGSDRMDVFWVRL